jgi:hypothetical protein
MPTPVDRSKLKVKSKQESSSLSSTVSDSWKSASDDDLISGLDLDRKHRSFGLLFGDRGSGKTTFITRFCPDPILLLNFDYRADDAVREAREEYGKTIHYHVIDIPSEYATPETVRIAAKETVERMIMILSAAVRKSKVGEILTIGVDTGDELTNLFMVQFFGTFDNWEAAFKKDVIFAKRQWMRVIRLLRQSNANVIVTARQSEIWGKSSSDSNKTTGPTGKFKPDASKVFDEAADWSGNIRTKDRMSGGGKKFEVEITKGGVNLGEEGQVYTEREWNKEAGGNPLAYVSSRIYGGEPKEWMS